jgi:HSP20 family protein
MLDSLKQAGINVGREIGRAWESLSEGWRELLSRSSNALTHYTRGKGEAPGGELASFPRWGLLAGEVEETAKDIMVRVELPGLGKEDCRVNIEGNVLYMSGEKRIERESGDSTYHVMERAYGSFQRAIPLPRSVDAERAEASFRNGVLTVRIPKSAATPGTAVRIS